MVTFLGIPNPPKMTGERMRKQKLDMLKTKSDEEKAEKVVADDAADVIRRRRDTEEEIARETRRAVAEREESIRLAAQAEADRNSAAAVQRDIDFRKRKELEPFIQPEGTKAPPPNMTAEEWGVRRREQDIDRPHADEDIVKAYEAAGGKKGWIQSDQDIESGKDKAWERSRTEKLDEEKRVKDKRDYEQSLEEAKRKLAEAAKDKADKKADEEKKEKDNRRDNVWTRRGDVAKYRAAERSARLEADAAYDEAYAKNPDATPEEKNAAGMLAKRKVEAKAEEAKVMRENAEAALEDYDISGMEEDTQKILNLPESTPQERKQKVEAVSRGAVEAVKSGRMTPQEAVEIYNYAKALQQGNGEVGPRGPVGNAAPSGGPVDYRAAGYRRRQEEEQAAETKRTGGPVDMRPTPNSPTVEADIAAMDARARDQYKNDPQYAQYQAEVAARKEREERLPKEYKESRAKQLVNKVADYAKQLDARSRWESAGYVEASAPPEQPTPEEYAIVRAYLSDKEAQATTKAEKAAVEVKRKQLERAMLDAHDVRSNYVPREGEGAYPQRPAVPSKVERHYGKPRIDMLRKK